MAGTASWRIHHVRSRVVMALVVTVAAVPAVRLALLVRGGNDTQHFDYWYVLDRVLTSGGGIDLHGLFTIHDIHPLVVAGLLYWANARSTGGSNIVLGYLVVVIATVQVALVARWASRTIDASADEVRPVTLTARKAVLFLAAAYLLLTPAGAWNFLEAMSGAAWLPANIFVLLAIWCLVRDRPVAALALGALASISYGTGLLVWPVLVVLAVLRSEGARLAVRSAAPYAAAGCAFAALYSLAPTSGNEFLQQNGSPTLGWTTPRAFLAVAGFSLSASLPVASVLGAAGVVAGGVLSRWIVARGRAGLIWVGMWLYAVLAIGLMSLGRTQAFRFVGAADFSRYASLAGLLWVSVVAMMLMLVSDRQVWSVALLVGCAMVATTIAGQRYVVQQRAKMPAQTQLAVALRVDVADGSNYYLVRFPEITERLRRIHHYPFDGDFTWDCGTIGSTVANRAGSADSADSELAPQDGSVLTVQGDIRMPGAVVLTGWVDAGQPVRCVAVVDAGGRVVGTGFADAPTPPQVLREGHTDDRSAGVVAITPGGSGPYRLLVGFTRGGRLYEVRRSP